MGILRIFAVGLVACLASCASGPYQEKEGMARCIAAADDCSRRCVGVDNGPARAACEDQCRAQADACYVGRGL